jgi:hypothetical protein
MSRNIKVTLIHTGAPDAMKRAAARVIDGSLLKAVSLDGRFAEAKAIYNRMLGIKSTTHEYDIAETDEPAYVAPEMPISEAGKFQQAQEDKVLGRMATMLAQGIADGVAKALAAHGIVQPTGQVVSEKPKEPTLVESVVEQTLDSPAAGTMRSPRSKRPTL